jgi:hypothetical protein
MGLSSRGTFAVSFDRSQKKDGETREDEKMRR